MKTQVPFLRRGKTFKIRGTPATWGAIQAPTIIKWGISDIRAGIKDGIVFGCIMKLKLEFFGWDPCETKM